MTRHAPSLRTMTLAWVAAAFCSGLLSSWLWLDSARKWDAYLMHAYEVGFSIYETLRAGTPLPEGIRISGLTPDEAALANQGMFARLPSAPQPAFVTNLSILDSAGEAFSGDIISLAIVSDALQYRASALGSSPNATAPQKMANLTRMLATYCSEPTLYALVGNGQWQRIEGGPVWSCHAAPRDYRLLAGVLAIIALGIIYTLVSDTTATFGRFAQALRVRRRLGGPQSYETEGPAELRDMVDAVNSYLAQERDQLAQRAEILSGVSHDLGTPATRLRLRTTLITDEDLRTKLDADIDRMTGMIESVLTFTRSEMSMEDPRRLSLTSLVEAIVDDYRDTGKPVDLLPMQAPVASGGQSVFMSRRGTGLLPDEQKVLAIVRPILLQRAIANLIDNALKYGRRAHVSLSATSETATITVEDEGDFRPEDMLELTAPFRRGENVGAVVGFGLGLTIVQTVAEQHGGTVEFETGLKGLRVRLTIQRS